MCISAAEAMFSGTTLYAGRRNHPDHGLIHVIGYQNTAENLSAGPNAMVLHLPAVHMTPDHFIDVGRDADILERMVDAVRPVPASAPAVMDWMGDDDRTRAVHVFEHDVYTVVLASDPALIPAALGQVPAHRRPALTPELFAFYAERYPTHTIALCCFDNAQAQRAKPLLMWYEPLDAGQLALPALDCHTGGAPDLEAEVEVDHWVLFGTDEATGLWGGVVDYRVGMRHRLREFLPDTVVGRRFEGAMPNGDFVVDHEDLLTGGLDAVRRVGPA
ncbi:hypothetical protein [Streptomyces sp. NBC_00306]|uniref:hypothetical protein n=1 Tax=Streptomyces sp. NBC_00306 TaxID=2975708 RepID=UPI002E2B1615|nr:hypothetical protein [Streptomyces sp. NBC_00306]